MKKRRRLAEKLKVAVCLLSVIVSTLFYAPMEIYAKNYDVTTTQKIRFNSTSFSVLFGNAYKPDADTTVDIGSQQTFYIKAMIPVSLRPIFNPGGNVECYGNTTQINLSGGFDLGYTVDNKSNGNSALTFVSFTESFLCFNDQKVPLTENNWTRAYFDSSKYVNQEITGLFYIEVGAVVTSAFEDSHGVSEDALDHIQFYADLNPARNWLAFESRNGGASSGDIQDLENGLTNGFDNSGGNASHDKFQGSVNDYEAAEDSLFATATDNIAKFQFFDFQSISAVMTGITFITSTMTKIFNLSGGVSGVGIILSVLFSVMLVSMALGLYKRYQSTGHGSSGTGNTEKSDKGGVK